MKGFEYNFSRPLNNYFLSRSYFCLRGLQTILPWKYEFLRSMSHSWFPQKLLMPPQTSPALQYSSLVERLPFRSLVCCKLPQSYRLVPHITLSLSESFLKILNNFCPHNIKHQLINKYRLHQVCLLPLRRFLMPHKKFLLPRDNPPPYSRSWLNG